MDQPTAGQEAPPLGKLGPLELAIMLACVRIALRPNRRRPANYRARRHFTGRTPAHYHAGYIAWRLREAHISQHKRQTGIIDLGVM